MRYDVRSVPLSEPERRAGRRVPGWLRFLAPRPRNRRKPTTKWLPSYLADLNGPRRYFSEARR